MEKSTPAQWGTWRGAAGFELSRGQSNSIIFDTFIDCSVSCQELHNEPDRHGSCPHLIYNLSGEGYKQATSVWQGKYSHKEENPGQVKIYMEAFYCKIWETDCNQQRNMEKQKKESHRGRVLWGHLRGAVSPVFYKSFLEEVTEKLRSKQTWVSRVLCWSTCY